MKSKGESMPKIFAGVAGIVALAAGIFGSVDPLLCLQRAAVAWVLGLICGSLWVMILGEGAVVTSAPKQESEKPENTSKSEESSPDLQAA